MDRAVPVGNRLLFKEELLRRTKQHKKNLSRIKRRKPGSGAIDQTRPRRSSTLRNNAKGRYARKVREREIRAENTRLVEHMGKIFLDNTRMIPLGPEGTVTPRHGRYGLHHEFRVRQIDKINYENQILIRRLRYVHPTCIYCIDSGVCE
jgi:hypothetical protein